MKLYSEAETSTYVEVEVDGLKLNIHLNQAGSGKAVFMLHGSGPGASGWSNFNRNLDKFVSEGYRVILLDCPGWNKSDPILLEKGSRADLNAKVVSAAMDQLGIKKAHMVGNSMGGNTCISFALNFPEKLDKMVIMGGGGAGQSIFTPLPLEGIKLLKNAYVNPTIDNLKRMLDVFVFDEKNLTDELIKSRYETMMKQKHHLENFVKSAEKNPNQSPDYSYRYGEINNPTLITWGRDDRFVPLDFGLKMVWGLQNAELHIFSKCGHWAQWEHANKFNELVIGFLKR